MQAVLETIKEPPILRYLLAGFASGIIGISIGAAITPAQNKCKPKTQTIYAEQQVTATVCK